MEGYSLLERERAVAMSERQNKLSTLKNDLSKVLEEQKASIAKQGDDARSALEVDVRRIATDISKQILGRAA